MGTQWSPRRVSSTDELAWDDAADVVVVGYGGAGVVAALQARQDGADVLAIDRFGGGGATSYSGAVLYAGGTRHQKASGFDDTPEQMFNYLRAEGVPLSDDALRRYCTGSNQDLEWLEGHGVPYGGNAFLEKTAFPPDGNWLYYAGNENTPKFRAVAQPAPRGHRVATPGMGGALYHQKLRQSAESLGVRLKSHSTVERLVQDPMGRVIGVEVRSLPKQYWDEHQELFAQVNPWQPFNNKRAERAVVKARQLEEAHGRSSLMQARQGVILCTGGFIYNLDMLARYQSNVARQYQGLLRLGSLGCNGSGIELGRSVGGKMDLMDRLFIGSPLSPPVAYVSGGILVNSRGERYTAEDGYHADIGNGTIAQPDCKSWLIMEGRTFWRAVKQSLLPGKGMFMIWGLPPLVNMILGGTKRSARLEGLARKIGVGPEGLMRTVSAFNAVADKGGPDPLGKSSEKLHPIRQGPFYAVNNSLDNFWFPTMAFTLGGLAVDEETGEVRSEAGGVVKGLYAAGRAAVGICSLGYMSGLSIADTVFSGRRAAHHAASKVRSAALAE